MVSLHCLTVFLPVQLRGNRFTVLEDFKVLVKENEVPTEKNSCRASVFATKASYISN